MNDKAVWQPDMTNDTCLAMPCSEGKVCICPGNLASSGAKPLHFIMPRLQR